MDEKAVNYLLNKSVEDNINRWKSDLDKQVDRFDNVCNDLKNFESFFQANLTNIISMEELINAMDTDAKNNLQNLKDISDEEDTIIESLEFMEKQLDKYIEITNPDGNNNTQKDYLYDSIKNTSDMVELTQKELDQIENKVILPLDNQNKVLYKFKINADENTEAIKLDVNYIILLL